MTAKTVSIMVEMISAITTSNGNANIDQHLSELKADAAGTGANKATQELAILLNDLTNAFRDVTIAERGMNLLIETAQDLSSTLSIQELLRKIVSRARTITNANIAWITMLDAEKNIFRNFATEGNLSPGTSKMIAQPDFGAVSKIINSEEFFTTSDYLADEQFKHLPNLDEQFIAENIVSLVGFPIFSASRVQGVLFIADRYSRRYSGREISIIGSFAQHVGVAMENARAFGQLAETLETMEQNRCALEDHILRVEASARTHDEMMSLLAKGSDLKSFMERMATQTRGSIHYLDQDHNIREEYSDPNYTGDLGEKIRNGQVDHAQLLTAISRSRESGRAVLLHEQDNERSLVLALHSGSRRGDSLIICHEGSIDKIQMRNLERSTVALSIAKLWAEKRQSEQLIASSTLLRHLVLTQPPDPQTITSARERLLLTANENVCMAVISISGMDRATQTELLRQSAGRLNLLIDLIDDDYLAIGPLANVVRLTEALEQHPGPARIGGIISTPFKDLELGAQIYSSLSRAIRTIQKIAPLQRFVDQSQIGLLGRIFEQADPERIRTLIADTLAPIEARDPRNRSELKKTLLCFFDCQFNITRTAESLAIHVNTVRQRLDTLRYVTGGWDENPDFALELHVILRMDSLTST